MAAQAGRDAGIRDALVQRDISVTHVFELGGHTYECQPLQPLEQIHIARRLAPLVLGALKPEGGRRVILQRLAKVAGLGAGAESDGVSRDQIAEAAMELAVSILEAASAIDEETINDIIRKAAGKVWRRNEKGAPVAVWFGNLDRPTLPDIDGFTLLAIVGNYLVGEFKDRALEYVASLDLKPGPALKEAMGAAEEPRGDLATDRKPGEMWRPPSRETLAKTQGPQ